MTERFEIDDSDIVIDDMVTGKSYIFDSYDDCTAFFDLLNELHEENEQSKMMIATLRNIVLENEDLEQENKELKKENKQLKEQLEICKDARQAYKQDWKACVSYCDTYKDEIHTLKDNIQGLIEENKELKMENDALKKFVKVNFSDMMAEKMEKELKND